MGSERGKKQEEAYRKAADAARAQIVEDPLVTARRNQIQRFNQQLAAGTDVKDIDALTPYYDLYKGAIKDQQGDRMSEGVLTLGSNGGNAMQAKALKAYNDLKRQQDASGALQNAFQMAQADMTGQTYQIGGMSDRRNSDRANQAAQMYSTYLNRPKQPPLWQQIAQTAIGGAGAAAGLGLKF